MNNCAKLWASQIITTTLIRHSLLTHYNSYLPVILSINYQCKLFESPKIKLRDDLVTCVILDSCEIALRLAVLSHV